jgi:prephenate dehydratase
MKIGILGPESSYSEKAANIWKAHLGTNPDISYLKDISEVFETLQDNSIDYGVVPIENSIEGSVGVTLDLLLEHEFSIIGEVVVHIHHCLLSKGKKEDIRIILSHPQALAQCRHFIRKNYTDVEIRTTGSTSHAAKLATEFSEMAAIASRKASESFGLDILAEDIQDWKPDLTRFVVIARKQDKGIQTCTHDCKTSIIVYLDRDHPGALYEMLGELATRGINLTRIESRPSKMSLGDYVFYIDMNGSTKDPNVKEALDSLNQNVYMLKNLGSYQSYMEE